MKEPLFTGACTALVTPFLDGDVNYPMLERLLRRQMDAGIEAVVICGTTGEAPTLSDSEKLELFSRAKHFTGGACKIIAGTGSNSTAHSVMLSAAAEKCGADALLVVTPYYNKATADGLYAHYLAVAQAVDIPIVVYNVPSRTGLDIPVPVYERLSRIPNVAGTKEASTDITKTTKILRSCGKELPVWSGNDDMTVPMISLGAKGVISVLSNVLPVETQAMCRAALDGDFDTAAALQLELQPLVEALFCEVNPIPIKEAMKMIGYDCGGCRMPLSPMKEENRKRLQMLLS
ncbi:MAG: 4-hydroxy-tetrahydrodipicolinate synthase [Oscillospiraceae bacterium]|nr:4-hydroxy-tetrahydrodipicolinate synthase [Oscillospiraceae bacterium]